MDGSCLLIKEEEQMRTTTTRIAGATLAAGAAMALSVGPAFAAERLGQRQPQAGRRQRRRGSGTAMVEVDGNGSP